jgi:hypothetical protein
MKQSAVVMSKSRHANNSQDINHNYAKQALSLSPRKEIELVNEKIDKAKQKMKF